MSNGLFKWDAQAVEEHIKQQHRWYNQEPNVQKQHGSEEQKAKL